MDTDRPSRPFPKGIEPGTILRGYRIERLIGRGGMGAVFLAHDTTLHRRVAVKVLESDDGGPASGDRLLKEARNAAALNHPNICTIHEVGEAEGAAFIAMEYVDGRPLSDRIEESALPCDEVIRLGVQAAEALVHAHAHGVIHRDFKAANVMVTSDGRVKIVDFGLARRSDILIPDTTTMVTVAPTGVAAGTPYAMAPEQVRGGVTDVRTDIWALGVLLHEMAAGARPFNAPTTAELFSSILRDPPASLAASVPAGLENVIGRCLEKDPADRYQHAVEVKTALLAVTASDVPAALSASPDKPLGALGVAAGVLLLSFAILGWNPGGISDRLWNRPPVFESIAVLPLDNTSGDPDQEYLADGIQQALITELGQLPGFTKVIARASTLPFRNSPQTPGAIAGTLGVRAVVTGSVERTGDRVRVTAQLVDGSAESQVWGSAFERGFHDVIALQNDVVSAIAQAIELRLTPADTQRLAKAMPISPETYEAYLRGMYELGSRREGGDPSRGLAYLQEAIDRDPGDPYAYVGLAKGYATIGHSPAAPESAWIRARAAAERALTLAPDLADAHAVMGDVKLYFEWDWAGAERAFQRANELNPNLAMNHYHYAWYLMLMDRLDEAIVEHERARDLDPMTPLHAAWLADLYRSAGRYEDAVAAAQESLALNPDFATGLAVLGHTYTDMGRHDEAIAAVNRAVKAAPPWNFALGIAYARAGRIEEARQVLAVMQSRPRTSYNAWALAMLHGVLGDRDQFFESIAYEPHHGWATWVRIDPYLAPLHSDPRFAQLMARFKLPMPVATAGRRPGN